MNNANHRVDWVKVRKDSANGPAPGLEGYFCYSGKTCIAPPLPPGKEITEDTFRRRVEASETIVEELLKHQA